MGAASDQAFDQAEVKPGDVLAGKYRVDRVLGEGGMGLVVAATHTVLNDRVAVKFLLPHMVENDALAARFLREAQAAVRIKSPHIARAIDVGKLESGSPYMVMEYLEGTDLGTLLGEQGPLDPEQACGFALQTCEALAAAHAAGIVHRDIKPGNIFVTQAADGSPHIKVLDFGISKVTSDIGGAALTQTQVSMGSPLYMSPEQMRSARTVDARADIWSLGVVLYEMLTGVLPFQAESMPQLCALVLEGTAAPARELRPELPEGIEPVLSKCLEREAGRRYSNAGELAMALAPFGGPEGQISANRAVRILDAAGMGKTVSSNRPPEARGRPDADASAPSSPAAVTGTAFGKTDAPKVQGQSRRRPTMWAAGAAVAVLVGVLGWVTTQRSGSPAAQHSAPVASAAAGEATVLAAKPAGASMRQAEPAPAPSQAASAQPAPTASEAQTKPPRVVRPRAVPVPKRKDKPAPTRPRAAPAERSVFDERL